MRGLYVIGACLGLLVGCASSDTTSTEDASAVQTTTSATPSPSALPTSSAAISTTSPTTDVPAGTTIATAASEFGDVLFDGTGQAIYLFDVELDSVPACYDDCAVAWPPVLTDGPPVAAAAVDAGLLGTTMRTDGSTQVTYGGHPLYLYAHEGKNEVRCHNVRGFGGLWFAVAPTGDAAPL